MATSTTKFKDFLKSGFSTYFILDLLSFWNISLLFNFLNIESQPEFSKKFLWSLAKVFYDLGGLFQKVTETFKLPSETFNFQSKNIMEQMDEEKDAELWFGEFGISTNLLTNNFETYFGLSSLFLKVYIFRVLARCLSSALRKALKLDFDFFEVFVAESVPATPFMVISAITSLMNFSMSNFYEKLNMIGQILTLFFCISVLFVNHIFKTSHSSNKKKRVKANLERNEESA